MKILGIIAEYNPFHNGHKYHIEKAREIVKPDFVICVMSGSFVQRGEPAIWDKWTRAKLAVQNGIDAVFELPVEFAMATAERFAFGGVSLLNDLGANYQAFGTESSLEEIENIFSTYLDKEHEIKDKLSSYNNDYLKARCDILENDEVLKSPNNILAFEYIKAIYSLGSNIAPIGIKRFGAKHDSSITENNFASASHIRNLITNGEPYSEFVPYNTDKNEFITKDDFSDLINYRLISDGADKIKKYAEIREGLENRIYKSALLNLTVTELTETVKSKRYAYTAISRMLFSALLNINKQDLEQKPLYARLLAANSKGTEFLSEIRKNANIPIITKPSEIYNYDDKIIKQAEKDFLATDIYMCVAKNKKTGKADLTTSPVII